MNIELDGFIFKFMYSDDKEMRKFNSLTPHIYYKCEECDMTLNYSYCSLIYPLEKANLLPDDYRHLCCICYFLDKVGLSGLEKQLFDWCPEGDVITLRFSTKGSVEIFEIKVHDYKKVLLE